MKLLSSSAINFAFEQGLSIVCSRGNKGRNMNNFPSTYDESWITSVGGHDAGIPTDNIKPNRLSGSNYGMGMDLVTPSEGTTIFTTKAYDDDWIRFDMTSAAAPHVSGAIALLRSEFYENPYHTIPPGIKPEPEDYENMIKAAAIDLNYGYEPSEQKYTSEYYDDLTGWGQLKIGEIFEMLEDGYVIKHYTITQLDLESEYQNLNAGIAVKANGKRRDVGEETYTKAERREITGTITLDDNWIVDETHNLYVWGRSGRTNKGGFNESNVLYLTSYTEVTSGGGGNGIVPGIIHNSSLTVNAKTYQYRLNHVIELPLDNNLEMYITVFGKKDVTSVQDKSNQNLIIMTPNPANEQFKIRFKTEDVCSPVLRIYNILGQIVYQENYDELLPDFHEITISSQNLIDGPYSVEINLGYQIHTQKLMIIK